MGTPVKPYAESQAAKKQQVTTMFDAIAPSYDRLNRVLTLRQDVGWRRKAVRQLAPLQPGLVVDVATGTADLALMAARQLKCRVVGVDLSEQMLTVGRRKVLEAELQDEVELVAGDAENLPLPDNFADGITVGFGVRNFENLHRGLAELHRVVRPGGVVAILEPSFPRRWPLRPLFQFYFTRVLPRIGRLVSRDAAAYTYLPASVEAFPSGNDFLELCRHAGFAQAEWKPLSLGICALYVLRKAS